MQHTPLGVPYLIGGNSLANIGKVVIHGIWGGSIVADAVSLVIPEEQEEDDKLTQISILAYKIFLYGVTIASYVTMSPQRSLLRCAVVCIGSLTVQEWAHRALEPNSEGLVPETESEIAFYSLAASAAATLFIL
jgi:hypothetical protein